MNNRWMLDRRSLNVRYKFVGFSLDASGLPVDVGGLPVVFDGVSVDVR